MDGVGLVHSQHRVEETDVISVHFDPLNHIAYARLTGPVVDKL